MHIFLQIDHYVDLIAGKQVVGKLVQERYKGNVNVFGMDNGAKLPEKLEHDW